jgi:hypothetical protein
MNTPSAKQLDFLAKLWSTRQHPMVEMTVEDYTRQLQADGRYTKQRVGKTIDTLLGYPQNPDTATIRANRFAGSCVKCGVTVEAERGRLDKVDGSWLVSHLQCAVRSEPAAPITAEDGGVYIVEGTVYRVKRTRRGRLVADRLEVTDGRGSWQYDGLAHMAELTEATKLTLATAMEFGLAHKVCARCGTVLDRPESQKLGVGPTCAKHLGLVHRYESQRPDLAELALVTEFDATLEAVSA